MLIRRGAIRLVLTLVLILPAAARSAAQATYTELDVTAGDRLLFVGDSITHQCLYTQYVEDFLLTRHPDADIAFRNAGVSGDQAADALRRFDGDIASFHPTHVTVLLGMNDGSYQHFNHEVFARYERDMGRLLDGLTGLGARVVVMGPSMFDTRVAETNPPRWIRDGRVEAMQRYYGPTLAFYAAFMRDEAARRGLGYVDMNGPMNNITFRVRADRPDFTLIGDAVHPGPAGQAIMAATIVEQMNLGGDVWRVALRREDGGWEAQATGAKVSAVAGDGDAISFQLAADALPWVLPAEAREGYALMDAGTRLSRQALSVVGLEAGEYVLSIDGEDVGVYSEAELARGIELQGNEQSPMYRQALEVAAINKRRNEGPVRELRNAWLGRRDRDRRVESGELDPATEEQRAWVAEFGERVEQAEADARALLVQARQAARPRPLDFTLLRVR